MRSQTALDSNHDVTCTAAPTLSGDFLSAAVRAHASACPPVALVVACPPGLPRLLGGPGRRRDRPCVLAACGSTLACCGELLSQTPRPPGEPPSTVRFGAEPLSVRLNRLPEEPCDDEETHRRPQPSLQHMNNLGNICMVL